jgi:hypothetical protein
LCEKCDDIVTCDGSGHYLRPDRIEPGAPYFGTSLASTCTRTVHSLFEGIPIHFPTILCELTHYINTHEQQPYCVGTLSQMTERSAERRVRQETGWLAGGPLFRVATISRTTDTFQTHSSSFLTQRTYSCSNFVAVSSLVLELLKKCRVR